MGVERVGAQQLGPLTREEARRFNRDENPEARRPKRYVFRFAPEDEAFQFSLSFPKAEVEKSELVVALQSVLERLIRELHDDASTITRGGRPNSRKQQPETSA